MIINEHIQFRYIFCRLGLVFNAAILLLLPCRYSTSDLIVYGVWRKMPRLADHFFSSLLRTSSISTTAIQTSFLTNIHPFIIVEFASLQPRRSTTVPLLRLYQRARAILCPKPNQAMNNEQFRRLLQNNDSNDTRSGAGSSSGHNDSKTNQAREGGGAGGATPGAALGSRMRSSIPMTPYVTYSHEPRREGERGKRETIC